MSNLVKPHGSLEIKPLLLEGQQREEQLKKAQEKQKITHQRLAKLLADLGFVKPEEIAKLIGKYWNIPYFSLSDQEISPAIVQMIGSGASI